MPPLRCRSPHPRLHRRRTPHPRRTRRPPRTRPPTPTGSTPVGIVDVSAVRAAGRDDAVAATLRADFVGIDEHDPQRTLSTPAPPPTTPAPPGPPAGAIDPTDATTPLTPPPARGSASVDEVGADAQSAPTL